MRTLVLAIVLVGCGAARGAPRAPEPCACSARAAEHDLRPDAEDGGLGALVREHRPASPLVLGEEGRVELPIDWRTLPLAAELWRAESGDPVLVGDVVASQSGVVRDLRSGSPLWCLPPVVRRRRVLAGCWRLVLFDSRAVSARDPATGAIAWSIAIAPREGDPEPHTSIRDCHLAFPVDTHERPVAAKAPAAEIRVVDIESGRVIARESCSTPCYLRSAESDGALFGSEDGIGHLLPYDGGPVVDLPTNTRHIAGSRAISIEPTRLSAHDRTTGALLWQRSLPGIVVQPGDRPPLPLAWPDDDVVLLDGASLVRISAVTGEDVWRLVLSDEIGRRIRRHHSSASDGSHLVLGSRTDLRLLLDVDLRTGAAESLRLSGVDPVDVEVLGDTIVVADHRTFTVIDRTLDATPVRERLSMAEDVERSLRIIESQPWEPYSTDVAPWDYPNRSSTAVDWLVRLRPLIGDVITSRIGDPELRVASEALAALAGSDTVDAAALEVLRRTDGAPNLERARARARAADALEHPLLAADAEELSRMTCDWLEVLFERRAADPHWSLSGVVERAVGAGRDALLRTSPTAAPLDAFAATLRRLAPAAVQDDCVPSEDDAARAAVLRWQFELSSLEYTPRVPGAQCIHVQTLAGPLRIVVDDDEGLAPGITISRSSPVTDLGPHGGNAPLPWPSAPARVVSMISYSGPLAAGGTDIVVQLVDGEWRVVWWRATWDA